MPYPAASLTDFPNWLSPMLVKELRQGMRTHLFSVSFILLQAFMVLCLLIGASDPSDSSAVDVFFWFFICVAFLVAMPIRGFSALAGEMQLNTIDLIRLTRLSAWRITAGKWAALVGQTFLLFTGVLPYVVLRYFSGGVDLFRELFVLFAIFFASAVLTALTVGFSAFRSVLLRSAVAVAVAILCFWLSIEYSLASIMGGSSVIGSFRASTAASAWTFLAIVLSGLYLTYYLLDLGASRIAPEADNHATRKRLVALGFSAALLALPLLGVDQGLAWTFAFVALALVWIDSLTERPSFVPSIFRPFVRARLGLFAWFFTPGWHTGLLFFLLSGGLFIAALLPNASGWAANALESWTVFFSIGGSIVFPLLIIRLFFRKSTHPFALYILIQGCTFLVSWFIWIVEDEILNQDFIYHAFPIPLVCFFAVDNLSARQGPYFFVVASIVGFTLSVLVPLFTARPLFAEMRRTIRALKSETNA